MNSSRPAAQTENERVRLSVSDEQPQEETASVAPAVVPLLLFPAGEGMYDRLATQSNPAWNCQQECTHLRRKQGQSTRAIPQVGTDVFLMI